MVSVPPEGTGAAAGIGAAGSPAQEVRQVNVEPGPLAGLAGTFDPALVLGNDAEHHGQAQTGPLSRLLGGKKRLEDSRADFRSDAVAGVADAQPNELPGRASRCSRT